MRNSPKSQVSSPKKKAWDLGPATCNSPTIILVRPQMGENIGAAARVMMNFGCSDLRLVAPRDGWPNQKAIDMAVHAAPVVESAKIYDTLEQAVSDIQHVAVTTARSRDMEKPVVSPREYVCRPERSEGSRAAGRGPSPMAQDDSFKSAIVFGPERSGLTNDEVALADEIMNIPVSEEFKSLNLAQAVAIVCYEIFVEKDGPHPDPLPVGEGVARDHLNPLSQGEGRVRATKEELIGLFEHLEQELEISDFFRVEEKKPGTIRNIRNMLGRAEFTTQEIRTLRGIIRSLTGKNDQRGKRGTKL